MEQIFYLLCGLLYIIGIPFGWSYETSSIIICIYIVPSLCTLSTIPILYQCIRKKFGFVTLLSILYTLVYLDITAGFITSFPIGDNGITEVSFNDCVEKLKIIAHYLNISYIEINLFIYVLLFMCIIGFNLLISYIIKKFHK